MHRLALIVALAWMALPLIAQEEREVDVELFLAVDVSRSMSAAELHIQRRGYAAALRSPEVIAAIEGGLIGVIALTYVEWAGAGSQRVVVPWTLVRGAEDAGRIADRIEADAGAGMRRTSITQAIRYATRDFDGNGFAGLRRVIDVSGDGPNNQGGPVTEARDAATLRGIVINGLPLMTRDALSDRWGIPDLDTYYVRCVIGGPGAFVMPVHDWERFADAVRRKLVLEIAGHRAAVRAIPAQMRALPPYDCGIGEKIWQRNRRYFDLP
ncbi:Protein of unknown function [Cribrihabitans marinus]|uniref:VWFA domain-containing protein n=1 Tax=Cribrihabitans marinus TaxID=1227549 RepID=A0A1H6RD64_9RHOB|nr:DUF1194 domain-containing protein [Cribrihabitans marinus]GGH20429.1 hypothetical protein GCM10010973_04350 [Cribrihabitans marinus]SEI50477.1 Protein of unknown function [Cribrihabitans marinus]